MFFLNCCYHESHNWNCLVTEIGKVLSRTIWHLGCFSSLSSQIIKICNAKKLSTRPSCVHMSLCGGVQTCMCACGGQRRSSGAVPQAPSTLVWDEASYWPWTHHVGQGGWPASPRAHLPSPPQHWILQQPDLFLHEFWGQTQVLVLEKQARFLPTEASSQPNTLCIYFFLSLVKLNIEN